MKRNRRAGVEDRWTKTVRDPDGTTRTVPSAGDGNGKRWRARYVDDEGRERARGFNRKTDAQAWLEEVSSALTSGTYTAPEAGSVTVADVYDAWITAQGHVAPHTLDSRRSAWRVHVHDRWGSVRVADVRTSAVRSWVAAMVADELGAATIRHAYGLLRSVLESAVEDRRIPRNPCSGVKLPRLPHADRGYLSHAQVLALASEVDHGSEVVKFLAYTGLRWGEMAALRVRDFDMLRRRVNVSRAVAAGPGALVWSTTKTSERRSVPFPAAITEELAELMVGKDRDDLVFTSPEGAVLRRANYLPRVLAPAVRRCQQADPAFPRVTVHDLRHTSASLAISAGANVKAVQRMLGHARASMTLDVYADLFDADLDEVAARLDTAITAAIGATADALRTESRITPE